MLLSVCVIARDEAPFLSGCLESVRPVADEIVLVDTGSRDGTVEIAERHGCRVLHRAWQDDFSAARNAGIEAARGRWILVLDADERLDAPAGLRAALEAAPPAVGGFLIERHDLVIHPEDGQSDVYPIGILRLFRHHPALRYEGIVHERPDETLRRAGLAVRRLAASKLLHLVNALPHARLEAKQRGYLRLLDLELARDPGNAWARYYRGKTVWFLGRREEAKGELRAVAATAAAAPALRASAWCMLATLLSEEGERGAAVDCLRESLALVPGLSLAYYGLAETLYADGRFAQAAEAYRRVRRSQDPDTEGEAVPGDFCMTPAKSAYKLGCCHLAQGEIGEAEELFRRGAAEGHGGCSYGLARAALARGRTDQAISWLDAAIAAEPAWRLPRELRERLDSSQA
jgi:tetratricopeptide (TPR) repeat protein